jgi:hypothetical protein
MKWFILPTGQLHGSLFMLLNMMSMDWSRIIGAENTNPAMKQAMIIPSCSEKS